jgi:hypothetical protein
MIARDKMGLQILGPTLLITTPIRAPSPRRPAICATEMIIVPKSADEVLWASFAKKADEIREDILRQPESKVESPEVLLPLRLPPPLSVQVEGLVEEWFKVKTLEHQCRILELTSPS